MARDGRNGDMGHGYRDPAMEDPRVARTRATVLRSATDLLVEGGPGAVTMDSVVARSGVAKSTIYRHWATRDDLLVAVMECTAPHLQVPADDLPFEDALRSLVRQVAAVLQDPEWARVIPALLLLKSHQHGVADLEHRIERQQHEVFAAVLDRGAREGVIGADVDVEEASALLAGPLLFAHLTGTCAVDDAFADRVVDRFLLAERP